MAFLYRKDHKEAQRVIPQTCLLLFGISDNKGFIDLTLNRTSEITFLTGLFQGHKGYSLCSFIIIARKEVLNCQSYCDYSLPSATGNRSLLSFADGQKCLFSDNVLLKNHRWSAESGLLTLAQSLALNQLKTNTI